MTRSEKRRIAAMMDEAAFQNRCKLAQCRHDAAKLLYGLAVSGETDEAINICADAAFYLTHGRLPNVKRTLS